MVRPDGHLVLVQGFVIEKEINGREAVRIFFVKATLNYMHKTTLFEVSIPYRLNSNSKASRRFTSLITSLTHILTY